MFPIFLLFADAASDPTVAGAAALAMFCGVVLLGGRSVIGAPLQLIRNFLSREPSRDSAVPSQANHK